MKVRFFLHFLNLFELPGSPCKWCTKLLAPLYRTKPVRPRPNLRSEGLSSVPYGTWTTPVLPRDDEFTQLLDVLNLHAKRVPVRNDLTADVGPAPPSCSAVTQSSRACSLCRRCICLRLGSPSSTRRCSWRKWSGARTMRCITTSAHAATCLSSVRCVPSKPPLAARAETPPASALHTPPG